jgi:hypothetical protein
MMKTYSTNYIIYKQTNKQTKLLNDCWAGRRASRGGRQVKLVLKKAIVLTLSLAFFAMSKKNDESAPVTEQHVNRGSQYAVSARRHFLFRAPIVRYDTFDCFRPIFQLWALVTMHLTPKSNKVFHFSNVFDVFFWRCLLFLRPICQTCLSPFFVSQLSFYYHITHVFSI